MARWCSVVELLVAQIEVCFGVLLGDLPFVGAVVEPLRPHLGLASLKTLVEVVAGDWRQ